MKRLLLLVGTALLLPLCAGATDFGLKTREPGPGHPTRSYWWKFNGSTWELFPPENFALTGGGELRLQKANDPGLVAICRESTRAERDLLAKRDHAADDKYFQTILPPGITNLKLVSQGDNPLPVNSLSNVEAIYTYTLGGVAYRAAYMVNRGMVDQDPAQGHPTAGPSPAARPAEDKGKGEYFTAVIVAPEEREGEIYQAYQQLLATARTRLDDPTPDRSDQYVSHGMLGR